MQIDPYTIRFANLNDLAMLPEIERAASALFRTTAYAVLANADPVSKNVDLDHDLVWVLVGRDDRPVGFAISHRLGRARVHLHELDVHPEHARQGLGRRLIETVANWARAHGAEALTLTTFSDVPWNGPYYERLGFRKLEQTELDPALQRIMEAEIAAGLPVEHRICMQLDL